MKARAVKFASASLAINIAYCIYHIGFGIASSSWWLFSVGMYYLVLSLARFFVIIAKNDHSFVMKSSGAMLIALAVTIFGTVILSAVKDRGEKFHEIIAITIAVYAFSKITVAAVKLIKYGRSSFARLVVLRNISFASALVSILSLQRILLATFEGMTEIEIHIMNAMTGMGVVAIVFFLGIMLFKNANGPFT